MSQPWSPTTMRLAAIASCVSALSTLMLIFGSQLYPAPADFADRVALWNDPWFKLRAWTGYAHPFLCMLAAVGVWRVARRGDRGLALLAIILMGIWAYSEALQIALTNIGAGWNWFPAYAGGDPGMRAEIEARWSMFYGLWDGFYFLLLTAFLLANLTFGAALLRLEGVDHLVGWGFLAVAALSLLNFFAGYEGPAWTGQLAAWAYPAIQPAFRFALGLWLWRRSTL